MCCLVILAFLSILHCSNQAFNACWVVLLWKHKERTHQLLLRANMQLHENGRMQLRDTPRIDACACAYAWDRILESLDLTCMRNLGLWTPKSFGNFNSKVDERWVPLLTQRSKLNHKSISSSTWRLRNLDQITVHGHSKGEQSRSDPKATC